MKPHETIFPKMKMMAINMLLHRIILLFFKYCFSATLTPTSVARVGVMLRHRYLCSTVRGFPELYILFSACNPASESRQTTKKNRQQEETKCLQI